ncbi:MAG: hypothetical protein NC350_04305 [Corallococcus sp.]|nr:hypothetical protein [Corallococcus sp.]
MAETNQKRHSLKIDCDKNVIVTGVVNVDSVCKTEASLTVDNGKVTVKGRELTVSKLDVEQGTLTLITQGVDSVVYHSRDRQKTTFKGLFK